MYRFIGYHIKRNCFSAIVYALKNKMTAAAVADDDVDGDDDVNNGTDDIDMGN